MTKRARHVILAALGTLVLACGALVTRSIVRREESERPSAGIVGAGEARADAPDLRGGRAGADRTLKRVATDDGRTADAPTRESDPAPTVSVFVVDEDGHPVAGALVTGWSCESTLTDGLGHASLHVLGEISVRAAGFRRLAVSCEPGAEVMHLRLSRDRRSTLVFRLTGDGLTDADEVHLWVERDGDVSQDFAFAKHGVVEFSEPLEPGAHVVAATTEHLASAPLDVEVIEGRPTEVTVPMNPTRSIRGVVRDVRGAPLVGARVAWEARPKGYGWQEISGTATDASGRFRIGDVPDAGVDVIAEFEGYASGRTSIVAGEADAEVVLRKTGSVVGRVDLRDGGGVDEIWISATSLDGAVPAASPTRLDADGTFRLFLTEGLWRLRAGNDFVFGPPVEVDVRADGPTECALEPPAKGMTIAGRVVEASPEDEAAVDGWIRIEPEPTDATFAEVGPRVLLVRPDAEGRFRASRLPLGRYTVTASGFTGGCARCEGVGPDARSVTLRLAPMSTLDLRLQDPSLPLVPVPMPRRAILYSVADGRSVASPDVSDEGNVFENLLPGAYMFSVAVGKTVAEISVTVSADESPGARRTISLVPGATIAGTVRDATGAPVSGAKVEIRRAKLAWDATGASASDGRFAFEGLPPGTWRLRVHGTDDHPTHEAIVTAELGKTYEVGLAPLAK